MIMGATSVWAIRGGACAALLALAGCVTPAGSSMSTKGELVIDSPEILCSVDPTAEQLEALRARADYADIIVALAKACPARVDAFGIGATGSLPSLTMVQEDGGRGMPVMRARDNGRDVTPPDVPEDDGTSVVVTDPPPEEPPAT